MMPVLLCAVKETVMHRGLIDGEAAILLREEVEMLMAEREALLRVAGAAAVLVANLDEINLPQEQDTIDAAEVLSESLNALSEETLGEALEIVKAEPDLCADERASVS